VSDLSRLLGDVYGASSPPEGEQEAVDPTAPAAGAAAADDPPAPPAEAAGPGPAAPGWADDAVLDEAFAEWVPGPPADASAEERGMLADAEPDDTVAEAIDIDAWLGPDEGLADFEVVDADDDADTGGDDVVEAGLDPTAPVEALTAAPPEPEEEREERDPNWTRTSDDLLPRGRRGRRLTLTLRR
jgi:hypothetical protein